MIVSALLTSVGINFGLCVFFFAIYSVLRKQPGNVKVYAPRLVVEGKAEHDDDLSLDRFLPSAGWVRSALLPSEDELLSTVGLDAVVFMRIFILCLKVFVLASVIGMFVILPVNYKGDQLQNFDLFNITNESLERFSISNVKDGSKWLWVHFAAAYVITGAVCYLLYFEYKHISSRRLQYFYTSKAQPHHFTLLVRGIPTPDGSSISDAVESFFTEYHSSTYLSHLVIRRTSKLHSLMKDAENMYKKFARLKSRSQTSERLRSVGFFGLIGKNSDTVSNYGRKMEDLEEKVRLEQSAITLGGQEVPAAFVCFRSRYGMATAIHIRQSVNPTEWVAEQAPEPRDVYWPLFSTSFIKTWISKVMVFCATIFLTILFLIPVLFVQGLANLEQLEMLFPFFKSILTIAFVSQVITGYLPSLILHSFLSVVPPVMKLFSTIGGYISHSEIERSACSKMLWFTIWNIFFANVLGGIVASQWMVLLDIKNLPIRLAVAVPAQATFFISYVVTSGWTSVSSELTRTFSLIGDFLGRTCFSCMKSEFSAPSLPYHSEIPCILFSGLLGITYFLLAPLILPFLLVYFCLGYVIYRNQFLNVYMGKYETGGKFWPTVHNTMIFSLALMQVIGIGIFALKKLPLASGLTIPLFVMTLLFNEYCRKRFLPVFQAFSAESLIRKDREEQNDPAMEAFFSNLGNAYHDPALMPTQYSENPDPRRSPLLG